MRTLNLGGPLRRWAAVMRVVLGAALTVGLPDADDPRGSAADLLDRFVVVLIGAQPDPYRGGLRRAVRDPSRR